MTIQAGDKRSKIIEVALDLFSTLGYYETRLDEIAKQADVAKGTLYLYFKSKEDLFVQAMFEGSESWMSRSQDIMAAEGSFCDRLKRLIEFQLEVFTRVGPLIQQYIQHGESLNPSSELTKSIFEKMRERIAIFSDFFKSGIERGEFTARFSPMQMAIIFHQILHLNMKFQLFQVPALSVERYDEILMNLFRA